MSLAGTGNWLLGKTSPSQVYNSVTSLWGFNRQEAILYSRKRSTIVLLYRRPPNIWLFISGFAKHSARTRFCISVSMEIWNVCPAEVLRSARMIILAFVLGLFLIFLLLLSTTLEQLLRPSGDPLPSFSITSLPLSPA